MSTPFHPCRPQGFTLMETLATLLILGIVSVSIARLNGMVGKNSNQMLDLQKSTQLMQACAERVIAERANSGVKGLPNKIDTIKTDCNAIDATATFALTAASSASPWPCPTGLNCLQVNISTTKGGTTYKLPGMFFVDY